MTRYSPRGHSRERAVDAVEHRETAPPEHLAKFVHRYVHLSTRRTLAADYRFHALPDACTYVIFNQLDEAVAGVTSLSRTSEELNLGRQFSFVNIRLYPGVWIGESSYGMVEAPYTGNLDLQRVNSELRACDAPRQLQLLDSVVEDLVERGHIAANPVVERLITHIEDFNTVAEMATIACLSPRQLQRTLQATTGLAPRDFLKVMRIQRSLIGEHGAAYSDQSHFIRSFRAATGYTPGSFSRKYDV